MPVETIEFIRSENYEQAIRRAAAEQKIEHGYWDIFHKYHDVSLDIQKRLLEARGWDVSSPEAVDGERERRFRAAYTVLLPETLVVSENDRTLPITVPSGERGIHFAYSFALEDGGTLSGIVEADQLPALRYITVDGETYTARRFEVPAETPLGYHSLSINSRGDGTGATGRIIVCPDQAYLPEDLAHTGRAAAFNITLYGLRSDRNWGCGDFTDLRALIDWAQSRLGISLIGLNPLHAIHNRTPYNTSPYLPLSLYYKNLIYVDIQSVPEFSSSPRAQALLRCDKVQQLLARLRGSELVVYEEVDRLKKRFLKLLFREFLRTRSGDRIDAFHRYCEREGALLDNFALYCALDETLHKQDRSRWTWQHWPEQFHSPQTESSLAFAKEHIRLITFYKYIQFVLEEQLASVQAHAKKRGMTVGLYHDLALATDSCGSDVWAHRDFYVNGCRVGSPPDDFSPEGQDWAFPPPNSDAHLHDGYHLYRESIRKIVRHGGALRIDHVMRLFRLFWIPAGASAAEGTYVRDRALDLMRILALESVRSKNIVIGEDLGTVTDEIRDMLARFRILSYRLFYFERYPDGRFKQSYEYPYQALVSSSTHDLPTMRGYWLGRDIEARKHAGLIDDNGARQQFEDRRRDRQNMLNALHNEQLLPAWYPRDANQIPEVDGELHQAIVAFLARVPSMLLLLNQEDLTKETEQQNLPGSTSEYPNWQRKMLARLEDLQTTWAPYAEMLHHQLVTNKRSC
jgi:4-alpha-glucanotransferase